MAEKTVDVTCPSWTNGDRPGPMTLNGPHVWSGTRLILENRRAWRWTQTIRMGTNWQLHDTNWWNKVTAKCFTHNTRRGQTVKTTSVEGVIFDSLKHDLHKYLPFIYPFYMCFLFPEFKNVSRQSESCFCCALRTPVVMKRQSQRVALLAASPLPLSPGRLLYTWLAAGFFPLTVSTASV